MAPHKDPEDPPNVVRLPAPEKPPMSQSPPRLLIIGAGSRGNAYAKSIGISTNGICVGVVDPIAYKRKQLGRKYIWGDNEPSEGQEFADWTRFLNYERERRKKASVGEAVPEGVDGVFICVQDELHKTVILGLEELNLHIMCEKPLATSMNDIVSIYRSLDPANNGVKPARIFSIGHVLRYTPHNMLLRKLLLEDNVIGDILSINHTEPVGWWHFSHSYVRGNWRKESTSAPSLLTKSCHDIDLLLWLMCSPSPSSTLPPHLPSLITSTGALQYFNKTRKPTLAGEATNCLSCPAEPECMFSAKNIYLSSDLRGYGTGNINWPIDIVLPDIEDIAATGGASAGHAALEAKLALDYSSSTPPSVINDTNYFGRCVYEADNDVCDDQIVTLSFDSDLSVGHGSKIATFHMVAFTQEICERYTHIYGTTGEIFADSSTIKVTSFPSGMTEIHYPHRSGGGHGGGDAGLARQFVLAVDRVKNGGMEVEKAQREFVGCSLEEVIRSHAVVWAAEEARRGRKTVEWEEWWKREVEGRL